MSMESQQSFARSIAHAVANHRTDVEQWNARDAGVRPTLNAPAIHRRDGFEIELSNGQRFHVVVSEVEPRRTDDHDPAAAHPE